MRVLVTGHLGYIGTVMVPMLLKAGHEVVGLDSNLYENCTFAAGGSIAPVPHIRKDVRDVDARDLEGLEAIIHLAALSNDPLGKLQPDTHLQINHRASVRLARLAKDAGVRRFLLASSCSNYGQAGEGMLDETEPAEPGHGLWRIQGPGGARHLPSWPAADSARPIMRPATAYGLSPRIRFDIVLNNLVAWAVTTGLIYLKSDGSPWRPIVHIEDISRAFIAALEAPAELRLQRGIQCRPDRPQLPHPRHRRDRRRRGAGLPARDCSRRRSRHAFLPRQFRQDRARAAGLQAAMGCAARRRAALRRLSASRR